MFAINQLQLINQLITFKAPSQADIMVVATSYLEDFFPAYTSLGAMGGVSSEGTLSGGHKMSFL